MISRGENEHGRKAPEDAGDKDHQQIDVLPGIAVKLLVPHPGKAGIINDPADDDEQDHQDPCNDIFERNKGAYRVGEKECNDKGSQLHHREMAEGEPDLLPGYRGLDVIA